ncbi:ABC transporter ATP-binding protein [Catenulispora yoronensis]|uniref:ABC transporter ATP-binding protein n=1 Tax=Catenulispora yoronensis TaxID=450799 RepID=A0ABP5G555_9ACTN
MIEEAELAEPRAEAGIVVEDVTRSFGEVWAVRGMSLVVPYGRVTALVGPNGAGKTTLMLMLATLLAPTAGRIRIAGVDPAADPVAVRRVTGWMPDTLGMYDQLKVHEYLAFFADAHRLSKAERAQAVPALLATVRLDEFALAPVHVLSRGQKQRLALARALIHKPRVLLLDEPASGLDPRSRIELRDLLRRLAADGVAILVSSHILSELAEMADRAVFVSAGQVVASREMSDLAAIGSDQRVPWRIRARDPEALEAVLTGRGLAGTASPAGFELPPMTEDQASDLLAEAVGAGVRILAFGPTGTPLESAYLALTEEGRR